MKIRLLFFILFFGFQLHAEPLQLSIDAERAILMNAETGAILFEKRGFEPTYPASTTKIATALYSLHVLQSNLSQHVVAKKDAIASISPQAKKQSNYRSPPHWLETDSSHMGIKKDEEFRMYDLLCGMLICSANDAANVIAQGISGSVPKFMEGVNHYLKEIGCTQTYFNNPHGLHHPEHQTTAYDLALMARVGLKNSIFRQIVATPKYTCPQTNLEYERTFSQTNQLLRSGNFSYSKAIGVKTGTTQAAGKNLVAAAEEGGRTLIAVLLGYRAGRAELYRDAIKMFETAFQEPKMRRTLLKPGLQDLTIKVPRARRKLKTYLPEGLYYDFYPSEESTVKAHVQWSFPSLPIQKGAEVGQIILIDRHGSQLKTTPIFAAQELKAAIWRQILFFVGISFVLFFLWRLRKRRSHRPLF